MFHPQPEGSIYVSSIVLSVQSLSSETADQIVFKSRTAHGRFEKEISVQILPGHKHKELFNHPLELSAQDKLSVGVRYRPWWRWRDTISVELREVMTKAEDSRDGMQVYSKIYKNIRVTIGIFRLHSAPSGRSDDSPLISLETLCPSTTAADAIHSSFPITIDKNPSTLSSTTSEIVRICPRFRLLIIGNSGVGKSTLIQKVFGVKDVNISANLRGKADINHEFVAAENKLFVVHDSLGLEAGENTHFDKVKSFINERREMTDLKDRLHAIWICITVPYSDGRLLEAGIEQFLRYKETILGDIPVVVVLTKLDLLDAELRLTLNREGIIFKSLEEETKALESRRSAFLNEHCIQPLRQAVRGDIPHVAVSAMSGIGLEPTIPELVKTTTSQIEQYLQSDPSFSSERSSIERSAPFLIAGMAQRASIEKNVQMAVEVGKKSKYFSRRNVVALIAMAGYWKNLGASFAFSDRKVKDCSLIIHEDIIRVWNFNDPELALEDEKFLEALLDTSNLKVDDIQDPKTTLESVMSLVTALHPLIQEVPILAIGVFPIAGAVTLATLCHEVYKSTQTVAKRFMAYIVDLMYVMKILFVRAPNGTITPQDVVLALLVYEKSGYRNRIHLEIGCFGTSWVMVPGGRDKVLAKIEELIGRFNISDEEVSRIRTQIQTVPSSL